jgi:biotin transport system substrate-specific component
VEERPPVTISVPSLNRLPASERGITLGDFLVPIRIGERISSRARHVALIAAGAILIALSANYVVPVPGSPVPITGQTFAVLLVGGALGARRGVLSVGLYLVLGLFLPVYADHASGVATIVSVSSGSLVLGATGGYLIGFLVAAAVVGRLAELGWDRGFGGALAAMAVGNLVIYAIGLPWLTLAADLTPSQAIAAGLTPFVAGDVVKLVLAATLFPAAWWLVGRRSEER